MTRVEANAAMFRRRLMACPMTSEDLAELLGTCRIAVENWRRGASEPPEHAVKEIYVRIAQATTS